MSLHYFIDGTNVLYASEYFDGKSLPKKREALLQLIEAKNLTGSQRNSATVVFDGGRGIAGFSWNGFIKVIFSGAEEADTLIKQLVFNHANPASTVTVTNDKGLRKGVRMRRGQILSCEDFLKKAFLQIPSQRNLGQEASIDFHAMNEEFKKLWKIK